MSAKQANIYLYSKPYPAVDPQPQEFFRQRKSHMKQIVGKFLVVSDLNLAFSRLRSM